ncbi:ankyrin repeat-containing domain protein, partial [Zopfochytrium polystomum]
SAAAVAEGAKIARVVLVHSWVDTENGLTNPRDIYEALATTGQFEPWLDVVDHSDAAPAKYSVLVQALRKAAVCVGFASASFCSDENCVNAIRFAREAIDIPVIIIRVGQTQAGTVEAWESTKAGELISQCEQMDARSGWTDFLQHDLLRSCALSAGLVSRHPEDVQALVTAASEGDLAQVARLVGVGKVDPNASDEDGITPLIAAARSGHANVVRHLIASGADVAQPSSDQLTAQTPLHAAALQNDPAVAVALLDAGADPLARDAAGDTPAHVAASHGNPATLRAVVEADADAAAAQNRDLSTPLHLAAQAGSLAACEVMLGRDGVSADARDSAGTTPLHAASWGEQVCRILLSRPGAAADVLDNEGMTALHLACSANNVAVAAQILAAPGVSATEAAHDGRQPIHLAAAADAVAIVRLLTAAVPGGGGGAAAVVAARDGEGWTAAHFAAAAGAAGALRAVVEAAGRGWARAPADAADAEGRTPLHVAAIYARPAAVRVLLRAAADAEDDGA